MWVVMTADASVGQLVDVKVKWLGGRWVEQMVFPMVALMAGVGVE